MKIIIENYQDKDDCASMTTTDTECISISIKTKKPISEPQIKWLENLLKLINEGYMVMSI